MSSLVFAHVFPAGLLGADVALAGSVNADPSLTGALDADIVLDGSIDANPTLTGTLDDGVNLDGSIDANPELTGTLDDTLELAGSIDANPELTGDVTVATPGPVTYVGIGSSHDGDGTVAFPSGIAGGDFLMVFVETAAQSVSISSGWSPDYAFGNGNSLTQLQVFTKAYSPGDTAPTISGTANHAISVMVAFRGVNTSSPYDNAWEANSTTATAAGTFPAIDCTVSNGAMAVFVAAYSVSGVVSLTLSTGKSYSTPSFTNLGLVASTATGDSGHIGFAYGGLPAPVSHASPSASSARSGGGTTGNVTAVCILKA